MKPFVSVFAAGAALCASAFDSEAWLGKRDMLDREAERLAKAGR